METKRIRSKVWMLPTKYSRGFNITIPIKDLFGDGDISINNDFGSSETIFYHLYFTTDEEIKEGDWIIEGINNVTPLSLFKVTKEDIDRCTFNYNNGTAKKIVASTDTSLGLPQPSQAFIEKYVELGGINEVDLEYESFITGQCNCQCHDGKTVILHMKACCNPILIYRLKVDPIHNIITIHSIKDSWSREEIITDIEKAMIQGISLEEYRDNWVKENS